MHIAEVVTIAKSLPLLRLNTYKSLILSYSADYRRIFQKKTLFEAMKYLEKWYDIRIIVGQNISEDHAFTFTLTDEPIEEVMRLISRISPVQYHFNEDGILVING